MQLHLGYKNFPQDELEYLLQEFPDLQRRFERAKAKLYGFLAPPERVLTAYPIYLTDVPARYARAYAYHKDARIEEALAEVDALIAMEPGNPYFLELKGQVLLESGRVEAALPPLACLRWSRCSTASADV